MIYLTVWPPREMSFYLTRRMAARAMCPVASHLHLPWFIRLDGTWHGLTSRYYGSFQPFMYSMCCLGMQWLASSFYLASRGFLGKHTHSTPLPFFPRAIQQNFVYSRNVCVCTDVPIFSVSTQLQQILEGQYLAKLLDITKPDGHFTWPTIQFNISLFKYAAELRLQQFNICFCGTYLALKSSIHCAPIMWL